MLGFEESEICKYCMDSSKIILIALDALAGHIGFYPQKAEMMGWIEKNREKLVLQDDINENA